MDGNDGNDSDDEHVGQLVVNQLGPVQKVSIKCLWATQGVLAVTLVLPHPHQHNFQDYIFKLNFHLVELYFISLISLSFLSIYIII